MSYDIGSIVSFNSPTKNAILKGQIVLKKPAEEMFEGYAKHKMEYDPDTEIYSIRVFDIINQEKETYHQPQLCKVTGENIKGVIEVSDTGIQKDITDFKPELG